MDDQHIFQLPYLAIFSYIFSGCSTFSDKHTYNNNNNTNNNININNNSSNYSIYIYTYLYSNIYIYIYIYIRLSPQYKLFDKPFVGYSSLLSLS